MSLVFSDTPGPYCTDSLMRGDVYRHLSIDPSSSNMGIAIVDYYPLSNSAVIQHAETIKIGHWAKNYPGIAMVHGEMAAKLEAISDYMAEYFRLCLPHRVICESSYMGSYATAYAAGVCVAEAIRTALVRYNALHPLNFYDPASIKKAMGVKGNSGDKELMRMALLSLVNKNPFSVTTMVDLASLDEHSIDAVCINLIDAMATGTVSLQR